MLIRHAEAVHDAEAYAVDNFSGGEKGMGKLSELVERDYEAELVIITEAGGRLWPRWVGLAVGLSILWVFDELFWKPWTKRDAFWATCFVIIAPVVGKVWEQYNAAAKMRHQREVRMEVKLDTLLRLLKYNDDECVSSARPRRWPDTRHPSSTRRWSGVA